MNRPIPVSNGILEDSHPERIGIAIWEFLWLLDRMTEINSSGQGIVLGGKPIKLEDISLGKNRRTTIRNLQTLVKEGYIEITHAPYGLIIKVNKAKKIFGQNFSPNQQFGGKKRSDKSVTPGKRGVTKVSHLLDKSVTPIGSDTNVTSIYRQDSIDKTVDKNINNHNLATDVADDEKNQESSKGKQINELISLFRPINADYKDLFANKTEREALQKLIDKYGIEKITSLLLQLPSIVQNPYAPSITTPYKLKKKLPDLLLFLKREGQKGGGFVDARNIR